MLCERRCPVKRRASRRGRASSRLARWQTSAVAVEDEQTRRAAAAGFALEYATLAWNVAGIVVVAVAAISATSVALAGFALDSLIEIHHGDL
jgi:hypothetical protein